MRYKCFKLLGKTTLNMKQKLVCKYENMKIKLNLLIVLLKNYILFAPSFFYSFFNYSNWGQGIKWLYLSCLGHISVLSLPFCLQTDLFIVKAPFIWVFKKILWKVLEKIFLILAADLENNNKIIIKKFIMLVFSWFVIFKTKLLPI